MKLHSIVFLCSVSFLFADEYFVTTDGTGNGSGSSWDNSMSYAALNTAANWGAGTGLIGPGDTVYLSGGSYGEIYVGKLNIYANGSAGNPITIRPGACHQTQASGHNGKVTIAGDIDDNFYDFIVIDGVWSGFPTVENALDAKQLAEQHYKLKVSNPSAPGVHYLGFNNAFIGIEVSECGVSGFDTYHGFYSNPASGLEPTGIVIDRCLIKANNGDGINNTRNNRNSPTNTIIKLCHIVGNTQDGVQAACGMTLEKCYLNGNGTMPGEHGDGWQSATGGNTITRNNIFEAWPQTLFIESGGGNADMSNIQIYNNCFFYSGNFGYMLGVSLVAKFTANNVTVGFTNLLIAHNTFYILTNRNHVKLGINNSGGYSGIICNVSNSKVVNNIFYGCDPMWSPLNIEDVSIASDSAFEIKNNVFYGNTSISWDGVSYADINALVSAHPTFTGNTSGEPLFVSAPSSLQLLNSDEVARNAGVVISEVLTDFLGATRSLPDIGAYEFVNTRLRANRATATKILKH